MRAMPASSGPVDGDVVVSQQVNEPARFLVREVPHPPVLSLPSRRDAVGLGTRFAKLHLVDLWLVEGHVLTRLERRRRPALANATRLAAAAAVSADL
ncbi:hypothetical protein TBR22_A17870 [Luteitalea sp. TBR-22]|uniref:hypothetical protein n=1 Tax=Luteitalea sp. TBR-22 TaxID=2802971 RepID=UPI001AF811E7|nr:hypothetical protein [Luteitalea sp. TBR-22]BCS32573.1 hypothetical protein TBR22_A17870 [Luteitalea sp. TBR-22]